MCAIVTEYFKSSLQSIDLQLVYLQELTCNVDIVLPHDSINLFADYIRLIINKSSHFNLISKKDLHRIAERHIYESLLITKTVDLSGKKRFLDIGTGAGFPGLPLKIWNPDIELYLIESNRKKTAFLKNAVKSLSLDNVTILHTRAEDIPENISLLKSFDVVTARSVGTLSEILDYAEPFIKTDAASPGSCIIPKGSRYCEELNKIHCSQWTITTKDLTCFLPDSRKSNQTLVAVCALLTNT